MTTTDTKYVFDFDQIKVGDVLTVTTTSGAVHTIRYMPYSTKDDVCLHDIHIRRVHKNHVIENTHGWIINPKPGMRMSVFIAHLPGQFGLSTVVVKAAHNGVVVYQAPEKKPSRWERYWNRWRR